MINTGTDTGLVIRKSKKNENVRKRSCYQQEVRPDAFFMVIYGTLSVLPEQNRDRNSFTYEKSGIKMTFVAEIIDSTKENEAVL